MLYLAEDAPRAVRIACTNFLTDLNKICGCPARMTHDAREANVLVGVIGEDAAVDALAEARYGALKEEGVLRWEAYVQTLLPDGRLVVAGNGRRGAVYGVYDLSRRFGVSPWYFFADVPVKKAAVRSLPTVRSSSGYGRCCPRWRSPRASTFSPSPQSDRGCGSTASILPRAGSSRPTTGIFRQASARREDAPARRGTPCRAAYKK